jgi:hypothetical protein
MPAESSPDGGRGQLTAEYQAKPELETLSVIENRAEELRRLT